MRKIINMITTILSVLILCGTVFASDIIKNDLRVAKDGADGYILTSMPQEIFDSYRFEEAARMRLLSGVLICRKDGEWDAGFYIFSRRSHEDLLIVKAKKNLRILMDICDKVMPDERVIDLFYYADYGELTIRPHPDQWKNEAIHQEVAKKLNEALNAR